MPDRLNTDREIWRKGDGDGNGMSHYEPSIHVTEHGSIGINVGGSVYVLPVEVWHGLAASSRAEIDSARRSVPVPSSTQRLPHLLDRLEKLLDKVSDRASGSRPN